MFSFIQLFEDDAVSSYLPLKKGKIVDMARPYQEDGYFNVDLAHYFPLTPTIVKALGYGHQIQAFHVTDLDGLKFAVASQGVVSRQISVSTKAVGRHMAVTSKGGVLLDVVGNALLSYPIDVYSMVEPNGRRWIKFDTVLEYGAEITNTLERQIHGLFKSNGNKVKVGDYISFVTKLITNDSELYGGPGLIRKSMDERVLSLGGRNYGYDESVIDNFSIRRVYLYFMPYALYCRAYSGFEADANTRAAQRFLSDKGIHVTELKRAEEVDEVIQQLSSRNSNEATS
jgi:hypothetical protein